MGGPAGSWPVGEEWLHQAFTGSWRPVLTMLERLAADGLRGVLTLGITPTVAAMLDDPYCLREIHRWSGGWLTRAHELAGRRDATLRALASYEHRAASACLADLESRWLTGGLSGVLRPLVDTGTIELLGGPLTHPFLPLLPQPLRRHQLRAGLDDAQLRTGHRPQGIWAPECAYAPGMAEEFAAAGVDRFLVDGPSLHGDTSAARPVEGTDVLAFGRDLDVTYRAWSPRSGYPGGAAYRDFHTIDDASGFHPARVTAKHLQPHQKRPWDPAGAAVAVSRDVADFVQVVRRRLLDLAARDGRPGMVVVAYDTELFGHWWHEGPQWLEQVLRALPAAGVRLSTLSGAAAAGHVGPPVELGAGSWGSGKDWRVWQGEQVADLVELNADVCRTALATLDARRTRDRDPALDQLLREAYLAVASDWAFMVTNDSAAGYARGRAQTHADRVRMIADGRACVAGLRAVDGPFGHLDARCV